MNAKTTAAVSYITLIGWLISYFTTTEGRGSLVRYHLKQSFGILLLSLVLAIAVSIISVIVPSLANILSLAYLLILVLWILGIVNALGEKETPVPVVGKMFEGAFGFIK